MRFAVSFMMILLLAVCLSVPATAASVDEQLYPEDAGLYMGDWVGKFTVEEQKHPDVGAHVIKRSRKTYEIVFKPFLYKRTKPFVRLKAREKGDKLVFDEQDYFGEISDGKLTGGRHSDGARFELERYTLESPTLGLEPPEDATIIFDGENLDAFKLAKTIEQTWEIKPGGILQAHPDVGNLNTKVRYRDITLHLEFRTPLMPMAQGQERANSGVFLQDTFEVQILDSYGLPGYWNDCGALYQIVAPKVNMCLPPLQWQTYDIEYRAGRFEKREILELPRITVRHNGVLIHNDVELPHGTSYSAEKGPSRPPHRPEFLRLQAHGNRVQFRNIWMVKHEE